MGRLLQIMKDYVTVNGKANLCGATGRSLRMIERYLAGHANPSAQVKYKIARQCGCTHKDSLELAQEAPSEAKTA